MAVKRFRNIPRQWDKTKKHGRFAWPKRESLYPGERSSQNLSKLELKRSIRNLSTQAKISLLQPELEKAKKEVSEQMLLGPALGDDMSSLPDEPWFSKSPEEKYEDVIQEEHGQYEDPGFEDEDMSGKPISELSGDLGFVGEQEGEAEGKLSFLEGQRQQDIADYMDYGIKTDDSTKPFDTTLESLSYRADTEGESVLDQIPREEKGRVASMADFKGEEEGSWWDEVKGLFSSDSIGRDETLEQETKDNEALSGKIGAAAKLYSLLKPETQQAAPTIPTARITRGSVAFPGMQLASQKARRKYFTPKGLMA